MVSEASPLFLREPQARRGIVPGLDGLRALSIMIVLVGHMVLPEKSGGGVAALGVFIFFVISGFLVTRLFFVESKATGTINIPAFYVRRFLRLYPVLLAYMAIATIVAIIANVTLHPIEYASVLLYFVNYLRSWQEFHGLAPTVLPIGIFWSLSVEEHFYLLAPFVVLFGRGRPRVILTYGLIASIVPLLLRMAYISIWPQIIGTDVVYRLSEARFDSIAAGVVLAALCEFPTAGRLVRTLAGYKALAVGVVLLLLSYGVRDPLFKETLRYSLRNIFGLILVAHVVFYQRASIMQRLANWPIADWIGKLSYSLYIWHGMALWYAELHHMPHNTKVGLEMLAATFVMATISYYAFEQPFLLLKKRFEVGKSPREHSPTEPTIEAKIPATESY